MPSGHAREPGIIERLSVITYASRLKRSMSRLTFAVLSALAVLILPPAVQGQRTESEIVELFTKSATAVFERAKAKPSADATGLLRDLIAEGVSRLVSDKRTSDRDISAVVELMRRFAGEMVKHGTRQQDGTIRLTDDSFAAAQRSVCPLYPFC